MKAFLKILFLAALLVAISATTSFSRSNPPELYFRINMEQRILPDQSFSIFPGEEAVLVWDENELIVLSVVEITKDGCVIRRDFDDEFLIAPGVNYPVKVFFHHRLYSFIITYIPTKGVVVKELEMKIAKRE